MIAGLLPTVVNHGTGHCKVAMTSIRLLNETTTSDSAYWPDIWLNANSVLTRCVDLGIGGYHHVGTKNLRRLSYYLSLLKLLKANST